MRSFTATIAACATLASQVNAFWGTAHLLVARRAQSILESSNPAVLSAAVEELAVLQKYYPTLVTEGDHPFTECATFADDCKGKGYSFQSSWHYINLPYLDEAGTTLDDFDFKMPDTDVVQALDAFTKFLKGEISASESTYTSQVASHFSYENDQRSFALRMLVHYVGDIHQPLHSAALVDSHYPSGDRGGNSEKIPSKDGVGTLHYVWDSVLYNYTARPSLPLNESSWEWYTTEAETIDKTFPVEASKVLSKEFDVWSQESEEMAEQNVYPDFVEGEDPDQDYIDANLPLMQARMNLAGARLADLMVDIYGTSSFKPSIYQ